MESIKRRATYKDVLDAPAYKVAEIIEGQLHLSPRPGGPHSAVAAAMFRRLGPFDADGGELGGWVFLFEPELHLGDQIVVPDLAGWRSERMPLVPKGAFFTEPPDWICEVLSKSTEKMDRTEKLPIYAAAGVGHAWLVRPRRRIVEPFQLDGGRWRALTSYRDDDRARVPPFEAIELDLARLWKQLPPPTRASESTEYFDYEVP